VVGRNDAVESVIFMPGANTGAAGTPDIRVGIGTDNPQAMLDIQHPQDAAYVRVMGTGDATNFSGLELRSDEAVDKIWQIVHKQAAGLNDLHVNYFDGAAWSTKMVIQPGGNVGIGTAAPGVRLDVAQNTAIRVGNAYMSSGGNYAHFANNEWYNGAAWQATAAGALIQLTGQSTYFYRHDAAGNHTFSAVIDANGRVGIGTGGPQAPLEVTAAGVLNTNGWSRGLFLSAAASITWDKGSQANYFFMDYPSGGPPGDFWAGFMPTLGTSAATYVYRIIIGSGQATPGTVEFFNPIIAAGSTFPSDERLKSQVVPLTHVLERLSGIQPISYEWNEQYEKMGYHRTPGERAIGLTAQEVERVFPELVSTFGDHGYKGLDYSRFSAVLLEGMKEQQREIEKLNNRVRELEERATSSR